MKTLFLTNFLSAGKAMFLVVCGFCVTTAAAEETPAQKLMTAKSLIENDEARSLKEEIRAVATAAASYESKFPDNFLKYWLGTITSNAGNSSLPFASDIDQLLLALITTYESKEVQLPYKAVKRRASSLTRAIAVAPGLGDDGVSIAELKTLQTSLEKFEAKYPIESSLRRANVLNDQLQSKTLIEALKTQDTKDLVALRDTLSSFLAPPLDGSRIHILSARYGDLQAIRRSSRSCNALSYLVNQCEAKPDCNLATTAKSVCGYDPVPLLDDKDKALRVEYVCLTADREKWAKLQVDRNDGLTKPTLVAFLRTTQEKIACQAPG